MEIKKKGLHKTKLIGVGAAFFAASLCMFITLKNLGYIAGDYSIIHGDMLNIYIPVIKNVGRSIVAGENIFYTWNYGLGMNTVLNNAFSAYSIFNLFFLIPSVVSDSFLVAMLVIIKTGLAAGAFFWYSIKSQNSEVIWAILFSVLYSMCAFQVSYNRTNIIWMDSLIILPLIFCALDRLFLENRIAGLIIGYSYIFITQFYMGYMIGLVGVLYLVVNILVYRKERINGFALRNTKRFLISVLTAVLLASFSWVPVLVCFLENRTSDATVFYDLKAHIPDIIAQIYFRRLAGTDADVPNLYCGILTIMLVFSFFLNGHIDKKEKRVFGTMLIFMLLSCVLNPLYILWHGFDAPDGWTYRFSYIISFILCVMAVKAVKGIENEKRSNIVLISLTMILIHVLIMLAWYRQNDLPSIAQNSLIILIWAVLFIIYLTGCKKKTALKIAMLAGAIAECALAYYGHPLLKGDLLADEYEIWNLTSNEVGESLSNDESFFRINYMSDYCINSGLYQDYNTVAYFSSAEYENLRKTLKDLGLYTTPRMVLGYGLTPASKMLLDVKYDIHGAYLHQGMLEEELYARVDKNAPILSIGFMINGEGTNYDIKNDNVFSYNNELLSKMTGKEIKVFREIDLSDVEILENGLSLYKDENGYKIVKDDMNSPHSEISFEIPYEFSGDYYAYIYNRESIKLGRGFLFDEGEENNVGNMGEISVSYLMPMKKQEDKMTLGILSRDDTCVQHIDDMLFGFFQNEELEKAYGELENEQLIADDIKNGYIKGRVRVEDEKRLLFLSVPYDKAWKATVNGHAFDTIPLINGAFLGVELPGKGEYEVVLDYKVQGAKVGILMSLLGIIMCTLLIARSNLKKN